MQQLSDELCEYLGEKRGAVVWENDVIKRIESRIDLLRMGQHDPKLVSLLNLTFDKNLSTLNLHDLLKPHFASFNTKKIDLIPDDVSTISDITDIGSSTVTRSELSDKDKVFKLFETECEKTTIDALKEKAKDLGVTGLSKLKKPELISVIFAPIWQTFQGYKANVLRNMCKTLSLKPTNFVAKQELIRCLLFHMVFEKDVSCKKILDDTVVMELILKSDTIAKTESPSQAPAAAISPSVPQPPSKMEELEKRKQEIELLMQQEVEAAEQKQREEEAKKKQEDDEKRKLDEESKKDESKKEEKKKKQQIPKSVRTHVWELYIGSNINEHRCLCCKKSLIKITNFDVGHIIAEKHGGTLEISNLRPICAVCNNSMGTENMIEFVKKYGYYVG